MTAPDPAAWPPRARADAAALRAGFAPEVELHAAEAKRVRALLHARCGIALPRGKDGLIHARLSKRLRALGLGSFGEYLDRVECDGAGSELVEFVDALTTNKTDFFREPAHFDFLAAALFPSLARRGGPVRFWSAGCSTGEEPLTLAMMLREHWPRPHPMDVHILGTDVSSRSIAQARRAVYGREQLHDVPAGLRARYFEPALPSGAGRASPLLTSLVCYERRNLLDPVDDAGVPFDVILCRNVMIYFDPATQERLVGRLAERLAPGGYLLTGHAEGLRGVTHALRRVGPATFTR